MQKEESPSASAQPDIFQDRRGFGQLEHFNRHFIKNTRKKRPHRETFWSFFSQILLKTTFWMESLTQGWTQWGPFIPKSGHIFQFSKKCREGIPLSGTSVSVTEYAATSLNTPILTNVWLCQGSEYSWSLYRISRLLKMPWILNVPEFWIWDSCICKAYTKFRICLNMAQYASKVLEYAWICLMFLIVYGHDFILINDTEYARKCPNNLSDSVWVLNMYHHLRYLRGFWICPRH